MKRYETYKDSGVQWLGEIPSHWELRRAKNVVKLITDKVSNSSLKKVALENIESATGKFIESESDFMGDGVEFKIDDILFGKLRPYLAKVYKAEFCGQSVGDIYVLRTKDEYTSDYIKFLLLSNTYISVIDSSTYGAKMPRANWDFISNVPMCVPPIKEQENIVAFLDEKTAEIDGLVEQVEREIELLKEYKQAEIAHVVTHGLNPNAPMKPSGISWIGDIPEHWSTRKIKFTFTERSEKNHPDEPVLCATQSQGVIPQSMYDNRVVVVNKGFENLKFVKVGDFVISLRSFQGGIEYAHYQGIISAAYTVLTPNATIYPGYARLLMKSHDFIQLLKTCVTGIREGQNINYDLLKNKFIPIPPLAEQQEIVDYIDRKTTEIDRLVVELTYQVEYLKEYKQRLIADVVTGKINVQQN